MHHILWPSQTAKGEKLDRISCIFDVDEVSCAVGAFMVGKRHMAGYVAYVANLFVAILHSNVW